jgi:hypothetical protein
MPPHSSHLLQPLDVGCFAPLKKAYGRQAKNTEHQSYDFWVTFTGTQKTTAIDLGYRGHSGSTSYVRLAPRATRGGAC